MYWMLLVFACREPEDVVSPVDPDTAVEAPPGPVEALTVELAAIPTVVRVRWHTEAPTRASVRGTTADTSVTVEEAALATDHEMLLVGFPARADVRVEVVVQEGGDGTAEADITTGALPTWVPDLVYAASVPEAAEGGFTLASTVDLGGGGVVALDHAGRAVWAYERVEGGVGPISRARLSLDRRSILYNDTPSATEPSGAIVRVPLDGGAVTTIRVAGMHTDFVELPGGAFVTLGLEYRMYDTRELAGETLVEVSPDGEARVVWSVFDDFTPDLSRTYTVATLDGREIEDWAHINGVHHDPVTDDLYVTMTFNDGVARIDRGTGALVWWLADEGSDFTRVGDTRLLRAPHSVETTPEGLLAFNRGDPTDPETCSGATTIALDEDEGTAEAVWTYTSERCLLVTFLGSAARLPGGNTLVSWTSSGQLEEVTADGEVAWRVNTSLGAGFGFAVRVPALGDGAP